MQLSLGPKFFNNTLLAIFLMVVGVPIFWAANQYRLKKRYNYGLSQIRMGDSKQKVIVLMGQPDATNNCAILGSPSLNPDGQPRDGGCKEDYRYFTFLKPYIVTFDQKDRVIWKGYQVSP